MFLHLPVMKYHPVTSEAIPSVLLIKQGESDISLEDAKLCEPPPPLKKSHWPGVSYKLLAPAQPWSMWWAFLGE